MTRKTIVFSILLLLASFRFLQANDTIYAAINVAQAKDTIVANSNNPNFVILDVRTLSEYNSKHLEEGVNLDYYAGNFATQLASLSRNKTYLIHCASGGRSGQVFTMMQNLHFKRVYNMTGGINAWSSAIYPTTTAVAAKIGVLCDTYLVIATTLLQTKDSILVSLTNTANDTLRFLGITDLSGTPFSTNLNITTKLVGARDYAFYVYYNPVISQADSVIIHIFTNGGEVNFVVHANSSSSTHIDNLVMTDVSVFNDIEHKQILIQSMRVQEKMNYSLYDMLGNRVMTSSLSNSAIIDYAMLKNGMYCLRIVSSKGVKTIKLVLGN